METSKNQIHSTVIAFKNIIIEYDEIMNKIQGALLNLLNEFSRICDLLAIDYFAAGGTLLGAIRHKGFIPWDDDIDIYVKREDYKKLLINAPKMVRKDYFFQSNYSEKEWLWPFAKLRLNNTTAIEKETVFAKYHQGIWIDIFPLDFFPSDKKVLKKINNKRKLYLRRIKIHYRFPFTLKGKFLNALVLLICPSVKKCCHRLELLSYNNSKDFFGTIWDDKTEFNYLFPCHYFDSYLVVPFENTTIKVCKEYKKMLSRQYGEWEKVPEENSPKRKDSNHSLRYLSLKEDYSDFLRNK